MNHYKRVTNKLNKLLLSNEALARQYFTQIFSSDEIYKFSNEEIENLFTKLELNQVNKIDFLVDILRNEYFLSANFIFLNKRIFLSLLKKEVDKGYFIDSSIIPLIEDYSKIDNCLDDNFIRTILPFYNRLDDNVFYLILKSPYINKVSEEITKTLLDKLQLYYSNMDEEVLSLLDNKALFNMLSDEEIKALIERVSLNLSETQSLNFALKVIKNKNMKKHFIKANKLYNFNYLKDSKATNISSTLIDIGYYFDFYKVSDKYKCNKMIKQMMSYDPMFLTYFKLDSINDNSIKLDLDLLYGLIKSDYQDLLIEMTTLNEVKEIIAPICNYLHQDNMYSNGLIASLFNKLTINHLNKNLIKEFKDADISLFTHYLLNNIDLDLDSIYQYEEILMTNLENSVTNSHCYLDEFKNYLVMNRYGFSYEKLKQIYFAYGMDIDKLNDERLTKEFKEFKEIIFNKDKSYLYRKYMTNIFSFDKSIRYEQKIKQLYNEQLLANIISLKDLKYNDAVMAHGKRVNVVRIKGEFSALVSSIGYARNLTMINENYLDSFLYNSHVLNHGISTSFYSDRNPVRAGGNIIVGYSNLDCSAIQVMSNRDAFSNGDVYDFTSFMKNQYLYYKEIPNYIREEYNELVIERKNLDVNSLDFCKNIFPSYILVDDGNITLNILKISNELDLPIVVVDREKLIENNKVKVFDKIANFKGSASEYKEILDGIFNLDNCRVKNHLYFCKMAQLVTNKFIKINKANPKEIRNGEAILEREINKSLENNYLLNDALIHLRKASSKDVRKKKIEFVGLDKENEEYIAKIAKDFLNSGLVSLTEDEYYYNEIISICSISTSIGKRLNNNLDWKQLVVISLYIASNINEYGSYFDGKYYLQAHEAKRDQFQEWIKNYPEFDSNKIMHLCDCFRHYRSYKEVHYRRSVIKDELKVINYGYLIYSGIDLGYIAGVENLDEDYLRNLYTDGINLFNSVSSKIR